MLQDIIIVGFGGHGKSVADTIERTGKYNIIGYTDFKPALNSKYYYLGTDDVLLDDRERFMDTKIVIGLGYMGHGQIRERLFQQLAEAGYEFPVIIDPSAVVSKSVSIGLGSFVGKGSIVNADTKIADICIINSGSIVEHECTVGKGTHIAVGATVCGQVTIGDMCMIGANSTVNQCVSIGNYSIIGSGSVVVNNIEDKVTAVGVPAKVIKINEG